jgi:hypothetical protein
MNRIRSSYSKQEKLDCLVWQTGWSDFVDFDGSQGPPVLDEGASLLAK